MGVFVQMHDIIWCDVHPLCYNRRSFFDVLRMSSRNFYPVLSATHGWRYHGVG